MQSGEKSAKEEYNIYIKTKKKERCDSSVCEPYHHQQQQQQQLRPKRWHRINLLRHGIITFDEKTKTMVLHEDS